MHVSKAAGNTKIIVLCFQSEKSWDSRADLIPSLYVFECVELELALKLASGEDEPFDSDFSCPIKLHRGKVFIKISSFISLYLY